MARVTFVQTEWFEHLGLLSLAAYVRAAGHDVGLVTGRTAGQLLPRILEHEPDVVAFTATTGAHRTALAIAGKLRSYFHGTIIMGGPHPTFFPEVISHEGLDAVCRGEGEVPFAELLKRLDRKQDFSDVPGLWVKKGDRLIKNALPELISDLDTLPHPARDLLRQADPFFRRSGMKRVMAGRGCPYHCTYCFNDAMQELVRGKGPYVRLRGVDNVMAEIKSLAANGAGTINFVDDTFGLKRTWAFELLARLGQEVNLPYIVNLRPEQADQELIKALASSGCYCVQLGVESADALMRKEVLGREVKDEELAEAARLIKSHGMYLLTYNMVGLPGETLAGAARTIEWNSALAADFPRVSIFQPYPRTALGERILKEENGVEQGAPPEAAGESYFRRSPLPGKEYRRIENVHKLFLPYIRFPRLRRFILSLSRLPANPLFDLVFLASMGAQYRKATNRSIRETLRLGFRNLRAYFT
ncbi:MAG: radical SAM protein [bacterium]